MPQKSNWKKIKCAKEILIYLLFLTFFLIVFNSVFLRSQPIFSPGMVITTTGDTLYGEIGEYRGGKNYEECVFRTAASAVIQSFNSQEIRGYIIANRRYFESQSISIIGKEITSSFVEWIIKGGTSLFKLKDEFYLLSDDGVFQLVPFIQNQPLDNKNANKDWLQFLNNFALDCSALAIYFKEQRNLSSTEKNLIEVVKKYNECQNTFYIEYGAGLPFFVVDVGISLVFDYTNIAFKSTSNELYSYLTSSNFSSFGPALGMPIFIRSSRRANALSLYIEPSLRYFSLERDFEDLMPRAADRIYYYASMKWFAVGFPLGVRYTFLNIQPNLSMQIGPLVQILLSSKEQFIEELILERENVEIITTNRQPPFEIATHQLGYSGQINFDCSWRSLPGKWTLGVGFQHLTGIFSDDVRDATKPIKSKMNSFFIKAGWVW